MAEPLVRVDGIKDLRKMLRDVAPEVLPELREELKKVGEVVANDARSRLQASLGKGLARPSRSTGRAANSIRATAGGNVVYIRAGKATVPYYGWLDFGGDLKPTGARTNHQSRPFIPDGRAIFPAAAAHLDECVAAGYEAIANAERKAGFT